MANQITKFGKWLLSERHFRAAWFAKDPQMRPAPEEALAQLPEEVSQDLVTAANALPTHPYIKETIVEAVGKALDRWKESPHTSENSIVILGNPVSSVSRIMADGLSQLQDERGGLLPINILSWVERPADVRTIKQQVKDKLGLNDEEIDDKTAEEADRDQSLMIIPNLCWCFLRSADGLDGLDYLQDLLPRDRHQFWILGCGVVGWEYLTHTIKLHAYCGETIHLPSLSGEQVQEWLSPIVEKFDIQFPDTALHKRLQDPGSLLNMDLDVEKPVETLTEIGQEVSATVQSSVRALKESVTDEQREEENSPKLDYFNRLVEISEGNGIVSLQIFIKSLRYKEYSPEPTPPDKSQNSSSKNNSHKAVSISDHSKSSHCSENGEAIKKADETEQDARQIVATTPKLPPLPELSQSDMYLLYSLMLHGDMTVLALANSLGDAPQVVNNQVQVLRKKGVIEQQGKVLKTNPAHYPRLRRELARNNFIISVD